MKPLQKHACPASYTGVIALAGNPNVGKSTVFNALTGLHQHTGNWPGKTVAVAVGSFSIEKERYKLVDLPGTYSLLPHSQEEEIARDYILSGQADAVVAVCDATCLERNLILVLHLLSVTDRVVVCLNLMDEAKRKGIGVDTEKLSHLLGVPVVGVTARRKRTLAPLLTAIRTVSSRAKGDPVPEVGLAETEEAAAALVSQAEEIAEAATSFRSADYARRDRRLDRILTGRPWGYIIMTALLVFLLWLTIKGANVPSRILSDTLFKVGDALAALLVRWQTPAWLRGALIDGVYTVLAWVVSVMLPPMAIFFPLFTLLEDIGYMPRIAFNLDRPFHRCSACGKQALTMAMGFGCNAAGVTGCRIIDSPREKLLAILTNSFVPCNGRFPILLALITMFFVTGSALGSAVMLTGFLLLGIGATFLATKLLSATVLRGEASSFTLELPPYRKPQLGQILVRSVLDRTLFVLGRAAAVAAPAGLVLWILANCPIADKNVLQLCAEALEPLGRLMGMDGVILLAFILGWPANETVIPIMLMIYLSQGRLSDGASAAQIRQILLENGWDWSTALSTALFTILHWPCSTTLLTIHRETKSVKWTLLAAALPTVFGGGICIAMHLVLSAAGL